MNPSIPIHSKRQKRPPVGHDQSKRTIQSTNQINRAESNQAQMHSVKFAPPMKSKDKPIKCTALINDRSIARANRLRADSIKTRPNDSKRLASIGESIAEAQVPPATAEGAGSSHLRHR